MNYFKVEETTKKLHSLGHCQPIWVSVKFCKLICVSTGWNIAFLRGHTRAAVPGFGWVWPAQGYIKEFSEANSIVPEIRVGRSTAAKVLLQSAYVCLIRNKEWACWSDVWLLRIRVLSLQKTEIRFHTLHSNPLQRWLLWWWWCSRSVMSDSLWPQGL